MMLANHTSIRNLFKVIVSKYKLMRRRGAFLDNYRAFKIFNSNLEEFDQAEEAAQKLIAEYEASEKEDYINWGAAEDAREGGAGEAGMDFH
jgi:hypothetical protein